MHFEQNFFQLFGLPVAFRLDLQALGVAYRQVLGEVHPDRFAAQGEAAQRLALQWSTHINEGYRTLKNPVERARYLLQLQGVDTAEQTHTALPMDFLMAQMQWREAIGEARAQHDVDALEHLAQELRAEMQALDAQLASALDEQQHWEAAAEMVRKMRFFDKLDEEIADALEASF